MKDPVTGVGMHQDINPEDNDFMIRVRELVNGDPDLLGNEDIMKFVELALFKASKNEIAKELDEELSGYLLKNKFKAPAGVKKLQAELKKYTEVL